VPAPDNLDLAAVRAEKPDSALGIGDLLLTRGTNGTFFHRPEDLRLIYKGFEI